jgi:hypothetical protein
VAPWLEVATVERALLCDPELLDPVLCDPDDELPPPELPPPVWANAMDGDMSATEPINNMAARCLVRALAMICMFSSPAL